MAALRPYVVSCPICARDMRIPITATPRHLNSVNGNLVVLCKPSETRCICGYHFDPDDPAC